MAEDSVYVIMDVATYNANKDLLESRDFKNRGQIRYTLDNSLVLLEEDLSKFEGVSGETIIIKTESECLQYLRDNREDWEEEVKE